MSNAQILRLEAHANKIMNLECKSSYESILAWCRKTQKKLYKMNDRPVSFRHGDSDTVVMLNYNINEIIKATKLDLSLIS